jgi:TolB-like protein
LAFEDLGEQSLKNIGRPVRVFRLPLDRRGHAAVTTASAPLPLPDKPSISVLPFENMSVDPEQEYFADGMVEEIITALSRIRWLFVIARDSTFTYKVQPIDVSGSGATWRAVRAQTLRAQRQAVECGSPARMIDQRHSSLGRPVRRLAGRSLRDLRFDSHGAIVVGALDRADRLAANLSAGLAAALLRSAKLPRRLRVYFEQWDEPMISGIAWVSELIDLRSTPAPDRHRRRRWMRSASTTAKRHVSAAPDSQPRQSSDLLLPKSVRGVILG